MTELIQRNKKSDVQNCFIICCLGSRAGPGVVYSLFVVAVIGLRVLCWVSFLV